MSQTTKRAFAASLKKLLTQKSLDKIKVTDIAEDCGVNRQTFYYHFQDIYALIEWIYISDAMQALGGKKTYDTWQDGFLRLFEYALENKAFVINTYHSISREHLERYLLGETYTLLMYVLDELATGISVRDEDKTFIADFYKYGFVGLVIAWIDGGMKSNPQDIVNKLGVLIDGVFAESIEKFRTDRKI